VRCAVGSEILHPFKRQRLDLQVMRFTVSAGPLWSKKKKKQQEEK
jgi:hypothetical protein